MIKFVLVGQVRFTCQIQDMSDMIEAWKVPYSYKNFTLINNNKKFLHHFIHNIRNLYLTFLVFTEAAVKRCLSQQIFNRFLCFYEIMTGGEEHRHSVLFFFFLTPFDDCFCVDSFYFLYQSSSNQYFPQLDIFCFIGITRISVI